MIAEHNCNWQRLIEVPKKTFSHDSFWQSCTAEAQKNLSTEQKASGGAGGAGTNPPLWWLLDVKVMPLACHILHQVARPLLKGPVGRQVRVVMLDSADVHVCFVCLCALHIACYALQPPCTTIHFWKQIWCSLREAGMMQFTESWFVALHRQQVCRNSQAAGMFQFIRTQ